MMIYAVYISVPEYEYIYISSFMLYERLTLLNR